MLSFELASAVIVPVFVSCFRFRDGRRPNDKSFLDCEVGTCFQSFIVSDQPQVRHKQKLRETRHFRIILRTDEWNRICANSFMDIP